MLKAVFHLLKESNGDSVIEIQTRGCFVRIINQTSVLCRHSPLMVGFVWFSNDGCFWAESLIPFGNNFINSRSQKNLQHRLKIYHASPVFSKMFCWSRSTPDKSIKLKHCVEKTSIRANLFLNKTWLGRCQLFSKTQTLEPQSPDKGKISC